jgi:hypothetical protein
MFRNHNGDDFPQIVDNIFILSSSNKYVNKIQEQVVQEVFK